MILFSICRSEEYDIYIFRIRYGYIAKKKIFRYLNYVDLSLFENCKFTFFPRFFITVLD